MSKNIPKTKLNPELQVACMPQITQPRATGSADVPAENFKHCVAVTVGKISDGHFALPVKSFGTDRTFREIFFRSFNFPTGKKENCENFCNDRHFFCQNDAKKKK